MGSLRDLPAVHEILDALADLTAVPHALLTAEARAAIDEVRATLRANPGAAVPDVAAIVRERIQALDRPTLRPLVNATGVVLHTNLGRAPLTGSGYSNLEYDVAAGRRGKRDVHLATLLEKLLGAPGIAVNNNAAAVYLALNELAAGGEAIVSRGELIEIGDGFRIPDIMARSGATLREVGATNRTRIEDYRSAINEHTRLIMIVHPSNFRIEGFTGKPSRDALAALAREAGIPLYEDLGSGCLADLRPFGVHEPRVRECIEAGVSLVSFSGDKLLGGPQAGILAGDATLIARLRTNPMFRALRLDKLILEALATTLRHTLFERWDLIPALRMIAMRPDEIRARAEALVGRVGSGRVVEGLSVIGGGSTPEQPIATWVVEFESPRVAAIERALRRQDPPVIARIEDGRLVVDLRTVQPGEEDSLANALVRELALAAAETAQ
ncbi:MAG: L-seryl-tRNA(Sec) selenium transferase [Bryobacteraceae bacterium]